MDFIDRIKELATRIPKQLDHCVTEEATKNALIMPFINALGYDVFNPTEVVPEFIADIGIKKGEKVDYTIVIDGRPTIIFECKCSIADLSKSHASQLYRYFTAVHAVRFGVLTNGVQYRFFTDLDAPNRMDEKPFFEFDMLSFHDRDVAELKKFTKASFNLDDITTTASELKYTAAIKKLVAAEFEAPSDEFTTFLAKRVYSGRMTQNTKDQFTVITKQALRSFLNDQINERLKSAIGDDVAITRSVPIVQTKPLEPIEEEMPEEKKGEIVTTENEIEGYFAVKSILRDVIDVKRVHLRDAKSYCAVLLDDNNRKPIARLHFNRTQWYLGVIENKLETRIPIEEIDDIYQHSEALIAAAKAYDS